jgi:hypothetical protein
MKKTTVKKSAAKPTKKMDLGGSMMTPMSSMSSESSASKCPPNCAKNNSKKTRKLQKIAKRGGCHKRRDGQMICE